jgi:IS5 family transposase
MHGLCLTKVERGRMVYIHKTYMRETTFDGKKNFNIKTRVHQTVADVFGISVELVESALASLASNMEREREMGLWVPRKPTGPSS